MNPHNLRLDERPVLQAFCFIPIMLAVFPFPLVMPIAWTCMMIDDKTPWGIVIYFGWLIIGSFIIYLDQRKLKP